MKIQFNTDNNIEGNERLEAYISEKISRVLKHFTERITRVEIHLSDQNADKKGVDDIQCKIEARVEGIQPVVVTSKAESKEKAVDLAADKIKAALSSTLGKLKN